MSCDYIEVPTLLLSIHAFHVVSDFDRSVSNLFLPLTNTSIIYVYIKLETYDLVTTYIRKDLDFFTCLKS